ncbi:hypothetical protein [Marinigracilibium pacificum]|uniref:DUF3052 family protein n=1 Tax=Marinigracilibium pacificum TaxID=2729599 RepID=A0A848IVI6_9BACT|nr:hypothetical protein [Marinigracilibium pacificum]NMM47295.1 hypothetical protein [Marinigracilibium pacificum]
MDATFKKMNLKDQKSVLILNSPESFEENINNLSRDIRVFRSISELDHVEFFISFVTKKQQIEEQTKVLIEKIYGDALVWFCYPKGSSKKYKCDFNRDTGWESLGKAGMEPVRMVAVDEDWSALRFRKVEFIKKMTRRESMAISKDGKGKTSGNNR